MNKYDKVKIEYKQRKNTFIICNKIIKRSIDQTKKKTITKIIQW